jgi:hypothetical protein
MRFRFSLRTFLILVTAIAVVVGIARTVHVRIYEAAERHQEAIELLKYGYSVSHDGNRSTKKKPTLFVSLARKWIHPHAYAEAQKAYLTEWEHGRGEVGRLKDLYGLHDIRGSIDTLSLKEASEIRAIPALDELNLTVTGHADEGAIALLASSPRLKQLWLGGPVDDKIIDAIRRNQCLKHVHLHSTAFSSELMKLLCKSQSIEHFAFSELEASAEMLAPLSRMRNLRELGLSNSTLSQASLDQLSTLSLTNIYLDNKGEVDWSPKPLARIPSLKSVIVHGKCRRTEGDIASFADCPHLEQLILSELQVDAASLRSIEKITTLKSVAFAGELPEELAQQFVDEIPGRELTLYPEGLREWHKSLSKVKKYASKAIAP